MLYVIIIRNYSVLVKGVCKKVCIIKKLMCNIK